MSTNKPKIFIYNHLIYLNENQRYDLFACVSINTIGILVKAELNEKYFQPQQMQEIYCEYKIDCRESENIIEYIDHKICIHLPPKTEEDMFMKPLQPVDLEKYDFYDLLNKDEGGKEELFYETISHDFIKNKKSYHKIEIKDYKVFEESLEFVNFNMFQES